MGNSLPTNGMDSMITAGWDFCLPVAQNCTPVMKTDKGEEAYNNTIFVTKFSIDKANANFIIDLKNGSILDVFSVRNRFPYQVNISELFTTFTSPFHYLPANVTRLLQTDYLPTRDLVESFDSIFFNSTDQFAETVIADDFVDSLLYAFVSPLPSQSPTQHLRGFLAYALASNSGFFYGSLVKDKAAQTYILRIKNISLGFYVGLNGSVIVLCFYMLLKHPSHFGMKPATCVFQELTFSGKSGRKAMNIFRREGLVTTVRAISFLRDHKIYLRANNARQWRVIVEGNRQIPSGQPNRNVEG